MSSAALAVVNMLEGRQRIAGHLCEQLATLPGIYTPELLPGSQPSWYGLPLRYEPTELDGLPIERFYEALKAEGCIEVDRPGSTCPLNLLPLFQRPGDLLPAYRDTFSYQPGDFPVAEAFHRNLLKLPVWHRDADLPLVYAYIEAFRKVTENYRDLIG